MYRVTFFKYFEDKITDILITRLIYASDFKTILFWAICKPQHWNLGIGIATGNGIGIGTDITNVIISSFIRSMDPELSRVVTKDERTPSTKSGETSISWSRDK